MKTVERPHRCSVCGTTDHYTDRNGDIVPHTEESRYMRYAAAISAYSTQKVAVTVCIFAAASEDEAAGKAVRIARETWSPDEGWSAHQGSVLLIQDSE